MYNKSMLPETEYKVYENRAYVNPNLVVDSTNSFIDKLRESQKVNNQQIQTQTRNLGTQVSSNLGGLVGGQGYFTSRYQTPQTNSALQDLRTAAQAQALNTALANEKAMWQKRYQEAYRAQQKSAYDKAQAAQAAQLAALKGGVDYVDNSNPVDVDLGLTANAGQTVVAEPDGNGGTTGRVFVMDSDGNGRWANQNVTYGSDDDMGRHAGADQLSDLFTGMYNYTLPNGTEVELGGWDESLKVGSDGNYYIWNSVNGTYTPISGANGRTSGGGRWWTK